MLLVLPKWVTVVSMKLKLKTRKAAAKRYKITGTNNFLRRHAYKGHLLMKKTNKQKKKHLILVVFFLVQRKILLIKKKVKIIFFQKLI